MNKNDKKANKKFIFLFRAINKNEEKDEDEEVALIILVYNKVEER